MAETASVAHDASSGCGVTDPVRLMGFKVSLGEGAVVRFPEEPVVDCRLAEPLVRWLDEIAAPLVAARLGTSITAVRTVGAYECRNRNHAMEGKLSAHAVGLAVDIASFDLMSGPALSVVPGSDARRNATMMALRTAGCGWFTTILGPGSDAAHADHLHLDVQQHGSSDRYKICQ